MAVSTYDETFLDEEQREKLRKLTEAWDRANRAGDQAGMDSAHAAAERIRASANYRGGDDGGQYLPFGDTGSGKSGTGSTVRESYTAYDLPGYRAQTQAVNELYDAARQRKLSELKTAYDENLAALEAERAAIPGIYQSGRNDAAAQSELSGRSFKEYAAATGLNSGTAGQAELARANQLQGGLGRLTAQESEAQEGILREQTSLRTKYANDVASAIAEGEYERAQALLGEYRRAEESRVNTARDQAEENYRAYSSRMDAYDDAAQREAESAKAQAQRETEAAKAAASESEAQRKALEERAERLASFGNFSGYTDLGYTQEEVERMRKAWISKNPLTAYYTGVITREEYLALTGKKE